MRSTSATGKPGTEKRGKSDMRATAKTKHVPPRKPPTHELVTAALGTLEPFSKRLAPMT